MIALLGTTAKTFALYACLNGNCYVVDYNLSLSDCTRAMRLGVNRIIDERGRSIRADGFKLSCINERN